MSRSAFERLNPLTEAGQFGNAGRNAVRGPGYASLDVSLVRNVRFTSDVRLELRVESFNLTNHVNFGLPVADLNSATFVAEKIRQHVAATPVVYGKERIFLNCSIGVAIMQEQDTADSLLSRADRGLYAAKQGGRNCIVAAENTP